MCTFCPTLYKSHIFKGKAKRFPDEDVYLTKKGRQTELKVLLRQQKTEEIRPAQDVTDDFDIEM